MTDEFGRRWLKGTISGRVRGICQRCLEDAEIPVQAQVDYACVKSEAQGREFEPDHDYLLMTDEDKVPLLDLIEDEILLALPMIPRHSEEDCAPANVAEAAPVVEETDRKPFADLADLLKKQE
ncbi:MAG: DUF177 domain-containing protein [Gammaproteobacteria bacterium]|nr:DUF177 domain-containing protein [Gammaproteobacteria bacterium]